MQTHMKGAAKGRKVQHTMGVLWRSPSIPQVENKTWHRSNAQPTRAMLWIPLLPAKTRHNFDRRFHRRRFHYTPTTIEQQTRRGLGNSVILQRWTASRAPCAVK